MKQTIRLYILRKVELLLYSVEWTKNKKSVSASPLETGMYSLSASERSPGFG